MTRLIRSLALAVALSALAAPAAFAWPDDTHPQLSSTPAGTVAGGTWTVDVAFVSQGRVLVVDSLQPVITIREVASGTTAAFTAQPTTSRGIFRAHVVFPSAGSWSYTVAPYASGPGFAYQAVEIGAPAGGGVAGSGSAGELPASLWPVAVLGAALIMLAGLRGLAAAKRRPATWSIRQPR